MNISSLQPRATLRRPLAWFLIIVFLLIGGFALSQEETPLQIWLAPKWEGPLDPRKLIKWEIDKAMPCPKKYLDIHITINNPKDEKPYQVVLICEIEDLKNLILMRYEYIIDGIKYIYGVTDSHPSMYKRLSPRGEI